MIIAVSYTHLCSSACGRCDCVKGYCWPGASGHILVPLTFYCVSIRRPESAWKCPGRRVFPSIYCLCNYCCQPCASLNAKGKVANSVKALNWNEGTVRAFHRGLLGTRGRFDCSIKDSLLLRNGEDPAFRICFSVSMLSLIHIFAARQIPGMFGFSVACLVAIPLALGLGYMIGKIMNKAKGREMIAGMIPVSYTHLDVYKRQPNCRIACWLHAVYRNCP